MSSGPSPPQQPPTPRRRRPPRPPLRLAAAIAVAAATATLIHPHNPPRPALATPPISQLLKRPNIQPEVEFEMMTRMGVAIACGAIIGIERRTASANAGIRTLTLVSLGSAIFSLTALHGLGGDPSRMGAAISTGIGFLGSGAINGERGGSRRQLVTAASIWIAAALGLAAAAGLFRMAVLGSVLTVSILRWQLAYRKLRKRFKASPADPDRFSA